MISKCKYCGAEIEYEYHGHPRKVCDTCYPLVNKWRAHWWYHRYGRPERKPAKRSDCLDGVRPCPWISCKHHMLWIMVPVTGNFNSKVLIDSFIRKKSNEEIEEIMENLSESCTLDVADRLGQTLEQVGNIIGITRERVRQVEDCKAGGAIQRLRHYSKMKLIRDFRDMV